MWNIGMDLFGHLSTIVIPTMLLWCKISENTVRKGGFRVEQRVPKEKKSKTKITDPPPLEDDIDSEEENALRESRQVIFLICSLS